jgi:predicted phage terminase large subunit-like protein
MLMKELARRELARRNLLYFVQQTYPQYTPGWVHQDICHRLEKFSAAVDARKSPRLMLLMPPRHGKPIFEEERVVMGDGTWKKLKDIEVGDEVMTHRGRPKRVKEVFIQGDLPCVSLVTKQGKKAIAALDHPFLTPHGWVEAQNLAYGTGVLTPGKFELRGSTKRTTEEFALAGYLLSDGNTTIVKQPKEHYKPRVNVRFSNDDINIVEDFEVCATKTGFAMSKVGGMPSDYRLKSRLVHTKGRVGKRAKNATPSDWVIEAGLTGHSHSKQVPEWVFQGTEHQISRFLGAYLACDGTVNNPVSAKAVAEIYSVNLDMMKDLARLLMLIGVHGRIEIKKQTGLGKRKLYRLAIRGKEQLAILARKLEVKGYKGNRLLGWSHQFAEMPGREYVTDWIVDNCPLTEPKPCRCLEVEDDHTFIVNGMIVHNSELASIRFPAWHLGKYPRHELINVGYNLELPMKFSRKVREIIKEPGYAPIFPETKLDPDVQSAEAWQTTAGGGFTAAGVGGGITGKGAHVLIIDDPIKNQEEADSILTREGLWDWYQSTAYTRLAPGGGVLVVQTWWNDDDLAGRLQKAMRDNPEMDQFVVIKYPAIAEQYEYINESNGDIIKLDKPAEDPTLKLLREKGEGLHLDRYPTQDLLRIKANLSPRIWSALYQQNPVPDEGMYFKQEYFAYTPSLPSPVGMRIYAAWDLAIGEKALNDFNVGVVLIQDPQDNLFLAEMERFKGDSFQIVETILDQAQRWMNYYGASFLLGIEDSNIWKAIKPLYNKRSQERRIYPAMETLKPLTDKIARARPLQGRMQQRKLYLPEGASYRFVVQSELLRFPAGAHDDIVDALAWAVQLSVGKAPPRLPTPKKLISWKDNIEKITTENGGGHMSA